MDMMERIRKGSSYKRYLSNPTEKIPYSTLTSRIKRQKSDSDSPNDVHGSKTTSTSGNDSFEVNIDELPPDFEARNDALDGFEETDVEDVNEIHNDVARNTSTSGNDSFEVNIDELPPDFEARNDALDGFEETHVEDVNELHNDVARNTSTSGNDFFEVNIDELPPDFEARNDALDGFEETHVEDVNELHNDVARNTSTSGNDSFEVNIDELPPDFEARNDALDGFEETHVEDVNELHNDVARNTSTSGNDFFEVNIDELPPDFEARNDALDGFEETHVEDVNELHNDVARNTSTSGNDSFEVNIDELPPDFEARNDALDGFEETHVEDVNELHNDVARNVPVDVPREIIKEKYASPATMLFGYTEQEAGMPIYPGATINKGQLLALVLAYVMDSGVSGVGLQKLLDLLNIITPGCVPKTSYFIDKNFFHWADKAELHFYCPECEQYIGKTVTDPVCASCKSPISDTVCRSKNSFFLVMPLAAQLKDLLDDSQIQDIILGREVLPNDEIHDIISGDIYKSEFTRNVNNLTITFNTDGASVFKSSNYSIWPILCTVNELPVQERSKHVMLHSLWFGPKKPNIDTYFEPFTSELRELYDTGLTWHDGVQNVHQTRVAALLCVCDTVARAMVHKFKQFNGLYGCGFCLHKGENVAKGKGHTRVYPLEEPLPASRTHTGTIVHAEIVAQSRNVSDEKGVKGASPLLLLPKFDIVNGFIPEYMHSVCLGVTKQFVSLWVDGVRADSYHLGPAQVADIDKCLVGIVPPSEVTRKPRPLKDRPHWKASEWRAFLVLFSPIVLYGVLPRRFYRHWMLLVYSIWTLLTPQVNRRQLTKVALCLAKFVADIPHLYGKEHVTYNVHTMIHLVDGVRNWGLLWANSAFVFENTNGKLVDMFYGTQGVPLQIFKYYFALTKLQKYTPKVFVGATENVKAVMEGFLYNNIRSRHTIPISVGTAGLGKHRRRLLTVEEIEAIVSADLDRNILLAEPVKVFERAVIGSNLYSTKQYVRRFKRNNSVITLLNGLIGEIISFIAVRSDCSCLEECTCQVLLVFFTGLNRSAHQRSVYDSYSEINLMEQVVLVEDSRHLHVCKITDVASKCILIRKGEHQYVTSVPKFEFD